MSQHARHCRFRIALENRIGVECPHGYDVCPICDPCTCQPEHHSRPRRFLPARDYLIAAAVATIISRFLLGFPWPCCLFALLPLAAMALTDIFHARPRK